MKKTMKRFAAIIAAVMTFSAMSSMSVFATDIETAGGTATVDLKANTTFTTAYIDNPIQDVWNVSVDTAELVWDITTTTSGTYDITWNPDTQSYSRTLNTGTASAVVTNGATKNIAVTNKSNFDISSSTAIALEDGQGFDMVTLSNVTDVFTVSDVSNLSGALGETNTSAISITLAKPGALDEIPGDDTATKVGTATISFSKSGNTYAEN